MNPHIIAIRNEYDDGCITHLFLLQAQAPVLAATRIDSPERDTLREFLEEQREEFLSLCTPDWEDSEETIRKILDSVIQAGDPAVFFSKCAEIFDNNPTGEGSIGTTRFGDWEVEIHEINIPRASSPAVTRLVGMLRTDKSNDWSKEIAELEQEFEVGAAGKGETQPDSFPNAFRIPREAFETSGWRTITIARGSVEYPDGKHYRINVRLQADAGTEGDIRCIVEDINKPTDRSNTVVKLNRKA